MSRSIGRVPEGYGFVRQAGGQVRIESEPGRGTTMHLVLPRHHGAAERLPDTRTAHAVDAQASGEVILLIEDEATIRTLVTEELESAGYRVLTARSGEELLEQLELGGQIVTPTQGSLPMSDRPSERPMLPGAPISM